MSDQDKVATSTKRATRKETKKVEAPAVAIAAPIMAAVPPTPEAPIAEPVPEVSAPPAMPPAGRAKLAKLVAFRATLPRLARQVGYGLSLAVAVTAGWAGNALVTAPDHEGAAAIAFSVGQSQAETRRLAEDVRALKETVVAMAKAAPRQIQPAPPSEDLRAMRERLAGLGEGIEHLKQESGAKLAQVAAQLDRVEKGDPAKLSGLTERLDRIERQTATLTTGSVQTAAKASVSSQPKAEEQKPPQQKIEGWVLRDVFDGVALIEGRRGIVEIAPGQTVAGIGRIEKFERRGRQWVVVTDKGFIPSGQ